MERAWNLEVVELGYRAPLEDGGVGGGNEYDVYVRDLSQSRVYGLAFPELSADTTPVYFELDNNFTDPVYVQTRGLDALHVTVAHEFFHGVQFAYYAGRTGTWWQEASSTWMVEVAYPEVDDYLQYVPSVLRQPERALEKRKFYRGNANLRQRHFCALSGSKFRSRPDPQRVGGDGSQQPCPSGQF